jgi:hypothetical protein
MAQTILTGAYNLQTPEHGKFVRLDTASLTAEVDSVDSGFDPSWPKYAVLTYVANGESLAKDIANPQFTILGGETLTFNNSNNRFVSNATVISKLASGATGMYVSYVSDVSTANSYCWLNFSSGTVLSAGIDFNIGDTIKIDGTSAISALTVGVLSGVYIYADFYK